MRFGAKAEPFSMVSKPVRFHPEAEQEYLSSLARYCERSLSAAFDFDDEFEQAVSAIRNLPNVGRCMYRSADGMFFTNFRSVLYIAILKMKCSCWR